MSPEKFPGQSPEGESLSEEQREAFEHGGWRIKGPKKGIKQKETGHPSEETKETKSPSRIGKIKEGASKTSKKYARAVKAGLRGTKEGWKEKRDEREEEAKKEKAKKKEPKIQINLLPGGRKGTKKSVGGKIAESLESLKPGIEIDSLRGFVERIKSWRNKGEESPEDGSEMFNGENIETELGEMSPEDQSRVGLGLRNLGFFVDEFKNKSFALMFGKVAKTMEGRSTGKFWEVLSDNFKKDAERARERINKIEEEGGGKLANVGVLTKNVLKYGRTLADVAGRTFTSPLRYVMMAGMGFARGAEVAKEARFLNPEVIEKTRIEDADKAADIAWGIYEQAQRAAGDRPITAGELQRIYQESVPKDLIERLKLNPEGTSKVGFILQQIVSKDLLLSVSWIQEEIDEIDHDIELSEEERKVEKQRILNKHARHLATLDKAVSQQGEVDLLAIGAKYTETAAKTVVAGMMVETVALSLKNLWEWKLAGLFSDLDNSLESPETEIPTTESAPEPQTGRPEAVTRVAPTDSAQDTLVAAPEEVAAPQPEPEITTGEAEGAAREAIPEPEQPAPAPAEAEPAIFETASSANAEEYLVKVGEGGSVWRAAEQQLEKHFEESFTNLNEGQQTYIIDAIKDKIVADPEKYGLVGIIDVDNIPVGSEIDFSEIIQDQEEMEGILKRAGVLTKAQIENIERNNETLRQWAREHRGEQLTSEKVNEILSGTSPEPAPAETVATEAATPAPEEAARVAEVVAEEVRPETGGEASAETAQEVIPGSRDGEYIIPESGTLYNGVIRFGYDNQTGLPNRYHLRGGRLFGFNPESRLKDGWFETMREKLDISTERRGLTPQDDYLFGRVEKLEKVERIADKIPKNSPEGRYLTRAIGELRKTITERFGDVLKS